MSKTFGIVLVLVMVVAVSVISPPVQAEEDVVKVQLAIILDGSGSIETDDWEDIREGLASAVNNPACVLHDGTVELTVVQFGYSSPTYAKVEVAPVIITSVNAATIAAQIQSMEQGWEGTPMAYGIHLAADTLAASPNFAPRLKQVLNLVTDGVPNICDNTFPCPSYQENVVNARDYAIATLQMTEGQDEFDAEGIGINHDNRNWLTNNIIFPATGYSIPPRNWPPPGPGWVWVVENVEAFADTICEKFEILLFSSITAHKFNDMNGNGYQDVGEDNLAGWTMTLYEGSICGGIEVDSGTTDSNGDVVFTGLEDGIYTVKETLEDGWAPSTVFCQSVTIAGESETLNFGNVEIGLDHFKCYRVEGGPSLGEIVDLQDQFVTINDVTIQDAEFFCNPVEKAQEETTPILHPDYHLTLYTIDYEEEPRTWDVLINNQFQEEEWLTVSGPVMLAVPTQKEGHEPPVGLDHFLVYEVTSGEDVRELVWLEDQWPVEYFIVEVHRPVYFANPVQKTYGSGSKCPYRSVIENPEAHLVFYEIEIVGEPFPTTFVNVSNQFGPQTLNATEPVFLAVPSAKLDFGTRCLIATAAYGTHMAEEIQMLRAFRDEYLLTNLLGQAFVDFYYEVSPPIAEFIAEHPSLKPIVRAGLVPAVAMSTVAVNTTPAEKVAIIGLLVLVSVTTMAVLAIRRRRRGLKYTQV